MSAKPATTRTIMYYGLPLFDVMPYTEGTEPVPFAFHVQGTSPPVVMSGFNFSSERLRAGEVVIFVLDMFQRLVYSKAKQQETVVTAQLGRVEEAVVSSPYRNYLPNFACTDADGNLITKAERDTDPFYLHHLSSGTVRLSDKQYAPIQSTYFGGEEYLTDVGVLAARARGDLRFDKENRPLYLLGRRIKHDTRFFALHQDFFFAENRRGRSAYLADLRSDSPFLYEYLDGRECHFDIKPIPVCGVFPEEWELTTDFKKAQWNFDICLVPAAADGECFVKGEVLCFRRKVSFSRVPVYTADGKVVEGEWQWAGYTYYEAVPYPEYLEPLRGQGKTAPYYFKELPDRIESADADDVDDPNVAEYVRLRLVEDSGLPALHSEERVCRLCEYAPSRGVFYKIDEDEVRYPIIVTPDTSEGYGLPTAESHHAYDEITHECTDVIEHKRHRIVRQETELLLTAENDCWRQCGKIQGTIPPDLGDPREVPKRIVYVETRPDVSGSMPDITSLLPGTYWNLTTCDVASYAEYRSGIPSYPVAPSAEAVCNPGYLDRPGYEFLGFATYPNADEPLFMLSGDTPIGTLFPVWSPQEPAAPFREHTITFSIDGAGKSKFFGAVPDPIKIKYGSEVDLAGYSDETMQAYGLHFGGWTANPNFQMMVPRVVLTEDITLYAVWYAAKVPYSKPKTYTVSFGGKTELHLNRSSVLRLRGFNPDSLQHTGYKLAGWNTVPDSTESLFHLVVREDTFLYPVWQYVGTDAPSQPNENGVDVPSIYDPNDPNNPYTDPNQNPYRPDSPDSPYAEESVAPANPYAVDAPNNPYDQTHPSYPYDPDNVIDWGLFPPDPSHLFHPDNVHNPYHPDNPNHVILIGGEVQNPSNPYSPDAVDNPYHQDNPLGTLDDPGHPYHPSNPDNPFSPPTTPVKPVAPCEIVFGLTAMAAPRPYGQTEEGRDEDKVQFQVLNGLLNTPLENGIFRFRQQFLEFVPDLYKGDYKDKQTYCEDPFIPENERLTLTVDNTDGTFIVPTGGLSSSGAACLFDWDIWVDYNYVGRFAGNSGLRTQGITLNLKKEAYRLAAGIKASPRYFRSSREKEFNIPVEIKADGQWECLPFWVKLTDGGTLLEKNLGVYEDFLTVSGLLDINGGNTTLVVTKTPDAEIADRLLQGFVFYPRRKVNGCAVELVLLDFCRPDQDVEPVEINQQTVNVQYPCDSPKFTLGSSQVQVHTDSSLTEHAACVLNAVLEEVIRQDSSKTPIRPVCVGAFAEAKDAETSCGSFFTLSAGQVQQWQRPNSLTDVAREKRKCVPYLPEEGKSKIIIRPHYRTARSYGWLRAFSFPPNSVETWNSQENRDKVLGVSATITPSMFCDGSTDAGNYCMRYLFYGCRNLVLDGVFTFTEDWQTVVQAGNDFMFKAFQGCESLDQFPVNYLEPQHFVRVGDNFKAYKCYGCRSLKTLGAINTEPQDLAQAGYSFEAFEYYGCESLLLLPDNYNEVPQLTGERLYDYQMCKFTGCSSLRTLPDRYTETSVLSAGDNYTACKFKGSGLEFLPHRYSESLALTFVGKNCQVSKFSGCRQMASLPPQYTETNPADFGINFIKWKFQDCPNLVVNAAYQFPNVGEAVNKTGVFVETFAVEGGVLQNRAAEEIINGNTLPTDPKNTFGDGFSDYNQLPDHWKQ